jgi:hypothetical protein
MNPCAYCGDPIDDSSGICRFHSILQGDNWASANRIMCDFIHRGIVVAVLDEDVVLKAA